LQTAKHGGGKKHKVFKTNFCFLDFFFTTKSVYRCGGVVWWSCGAMVHEIESRKGILCGGCFLKEEELKNHVPV
jgi:hypothetical protein